MSSFRSSVEFFFKILYTPADELTEELTETLVWCHELEPSESYGSLQDWCERAFNDEVSLNFDSLAKSQNLNLAKSYQLLGKAKVKGQYDLFGEYDEDVEILECSSVELLER